MVNWIPKSVLHSAHLLKMNSKQIFAEVEKEKDSQHAFRIRHKNSSFSVTTVQLDIEYILPFVKLLSFTF